jgi:hypothetical protein
LLDERGDGPTRDVAAWLSKDVANEQYLHSFLTLVVPGNLGTREPGNFKRTLP